MENGWKENAAEFCSLPLLRETFALRYPSQKIAREKARTNDHAREWNDLEYVERKAL